MAHLKVILTVFFLFVGIAQKAQTTIVLQPGVEGKDSNISLNAPFTNYGSSGVTIYTWTNSGVLGNKWALIEFDLISIPENVVVTSAFLSLYFNPMEPSESFDFHYGDNGAYIQRITSAWEEYSVNWDNQPSYTTQNRVSLPSSISQTQDYLNIDVTALVNDMINDNNGFIIKMQNEEDPFRGLLFASSDHSNSALHPKLVITYTSDIGFEPIVDLGNDTTLCQGDELLIDAYFPDAIYLWQDNSSNPTYNITQPGIYWVIVSLDENSTTDTIVVQYNQVPSIDLGSDTVLCESEILILNAFYPESNYNWQDNSIETTFGVFSSGNYWVEVNNQCGTTTDSINVVYEDCDCNIYFPNVFTPNGDGINDDFIPVYDCEFSKYNLIIYNRWGNKIFETDDENIKWDGIINGIKAPEGVYLYVLTYEPHNKIAKQVNGYITLIR